MKSGVCFAAQHDHHLSLSVRGILFYLDLLFSFFFFEKLM